ncbi:flagellar biosynthesis anti-sigma factor FlgM [Salipaludibacillus agaradhaerens]|uniref:Negative regulator of flagellin synthesis n=1 Tax=Salipaludibacillus agaradhaerens TaxID=76935 RepID=A0A9Q4FXU2_SALAG|nr:flagellar biosynthesis anti-sigma factor FlgM [Salipaludibacillus agaradhaerens]MCR6095059.1 flagellar biosynthesis anti-sigma factor FlgM [Salipaludibacillus agaradhaerens]MCR6115383.1 flagellar biosynthesis anti-sigma factor FlgM [Salipaludibacillus agaradhaerens]
MKINPAHSIQQYRKSQEAQQKVDQNKINQSDKVQISEAAKKMAEGSEISPERQEHVNQVKQQIENGTYKINHQEIAKKLYEFWDL